SGNFKLEKKELDIHDLIHKVTDNFRFLINERGGKINLELGASKTMLLADETHLKNIIYNLLDNAQKYSPEQPVISITTEDTRDGVALKIADNGIGMDEHSQRYIFDKFYRANTSDVHDVKGFGLGLSYVKSVIEAHQASIKLMSKPNVGSTFTLQFKA
ncbi:MAG: ATP-binding protein, partial [Bacteroidota bacterium]